MVVACPMELPVILPDASDWIPKLSGNCAVCGDRVSSHRLGGPACLGCIVFFRRTVIQNLKYHCLRDKDCVINYEFRSTCRSCRLEKCLRAGMKPSEVRRRDPIGPKRLQYRESDSPPKLSYYPPRATSFMNSFLQVQARQHQEHRDQISVGLRRADVSDVNKMLKWSINNAIEWASQFDSFRRLSNENQKCVISEYGIAFLLIDQGFKTATEKLDDGYWMLQNGSFLHRNYFLWPGSGRSDVMLDSQIARIHMEFVTGLQSSIKEPFKNLDIDKFEMAAMKNLMFLSPSFPKQGMFIEHELNIKMLRERCLKELMAHVNSKNQSEGAQRFGQLILLLGDIRCSVKAFYNQTKCSDLFDPMQFDPFVRSFLLN